MHQSLVEVAAPCIGARCHQVCDSSAGIQQDRRRYHSLAPMYYRSVFIPSWKQQDVSSQLAHQQLTGNRAGFSSDYVSIIITSCLLTSVANMLGPLKLANWLLASALCEACKEFCAESLLNSGRFHWIRCEMMATMISAAASALTAYNA